MRLQQLFKKKSGNILNIYCTAGFPEINDTMTIVKSLAASGVDIIELGMPYSDPVADGEAIQKSSEQALKNGMSIQQLFNQLTDLRQEVNTPIILMGYLNPVLQFGFENFCAKASEVGIDGLIIPDLPALEYEQSYGKIVDKYGLSFVFLVTPETSERRVRKLDSLSKGFLYAVTSSSTTGGQKDFSAVETYLQRLKNYQLTNPILAGFGVKDKTTFTQVCGQVNGGIIGSAYIHALQNSSGKSLESITQSFVKSIIE